MAKGPSGAEGFIPNNLPPPPIDPYDLPDDETEFGLPPGIDETAYQGTTPPIDPNIHVDNDLRC